MKFFKIITCLFICLLLIISSFLVVSADTTDTSDTSVNLWTWRNFGDFFNDSEEEAIVNKWSDYFINEEWNTNNYVVNDSILVGSTFVDGEPHCLTLILTDGDFNFEVVDSNNAGTDKCMRYSASNATYVYCFNLWYNSIVDSGLQSVDFSSRTNADVYLVANHFPDSCPEDFELYNSSDVYQSFIDYLQASQYGDMFYDVAQSKYNNFIWFYDCFDSYKGKYDYDMYTDTSLGFNNETDVMMNYLNSSVSFKDELYYTSEMSSNFNTGAYQHSESLTFYLKFNDIMQDDLNGLYANNSSFSYSDVENEILNYLSDNTYAIHYVDGEVSFSTWYSNYVSNWINGSDFDLYSVKSGTSTKVWYLTFTMPNNYTFLSSTDDSGVTIMQGCRTASSAKLFNIETGNEDTSAGGLGSNIDVSDLGNLKDKANLLNNGWSNGYPNQSGNYPYRITMYQNGSVFLMLYFKSKPSVSSYAYTDSQIKYAINIADVQGYAYIPEYNISNEFDITSLDNELDSCGSSIQTICDALSSGLDVASIATDSLTVDVVSLVVNLVSFIDSISNDVDEFLIDYNIYLWTNFVGTRDSYKGYLCLFNWDIGVDGAFVRDNSDDTHDYSNDYVQDIAPGEVDSSGNTYIYNYYYDNNGNVHGGGDLTYIPTETPTSDLSYDLDNYDFTGDLIRNSRSFFDLMKSALAFFPSWIWALVGTGLAILIALRIMGR